MIYRPEEYWENRLRKKYDLSGVGHISFSTFYNRWLYKAKLRALKKAFRENGVDVQGKAVCDVGCGTGFFVDYYIRNSAKEILGLDITQISIESLKKKYSQHTFIALDISGVSSLSAINRHFDIVNVFDVLYHIKSDAGFKQAIENITSLARSGSFILITDWNGDHDVDVAEHVKYRSLVTYQEILQNHGVSILSVYPVYDLLNRPLLGALFHGKMKKLGHKADNYLAPVYFFLDGCLMSVERSNLRLILARKN